MHAEQALSALDSEGSKEGNIILKPHVIFQVATSVLLPRQHRHHVPDNAIASILSGTLHA